MKHADDDSWIALGVAFGDALSVFIPGLDWAMVTDDYGTHAALRFGSSSLSLSAPTMLLKRVDRGEDVDVLHLANELKAFIEKNAADYR